MFKFENAFHKKTHCLQGLFYSNHRSFWGIAILVIQALSGSLAG